jgi:predicted O-methyltransferase YrrM
MSDYTQDWFSHNIPIWERVVLAQLPPGPVRWLELGSFEGRSASWVHDKVIAPRGGSLTCVDTWYLDDYAQRFDANMAGKTFEKVKSRTLPWLMGNHQGRRFDVIYVDADHDAKAVLMDAALSWRLLRQGGFMIFDDYKWKHPDPAAHVDPKVGIDAFIDCWKHHLAVCHRGYQAIVQKTGSGG